jgi:small subunit ribosomal protein S3
LKTHTVWVFKGEILAHDPMAHDKRILEGQPATHDRERGRRESAMG